MVESVSLLGQLGFFLLVLLFLLLRLVRLRFRHLLKVPDMESQQDDLHQLLDLPHKGNDSLGIVVQLLDTSQVLEQLYERGMQLPVLVLQFLLLAQLSLE